MRQGLFRQGNRSDRLTFVRLRLEQPLVGPPATSSDVSLGARRAEASQPLRSTKPDASTAEARQGGDRMHAAATGSHHRRPSGENDGVWSSWPAVSVRTRWPVRVLKTASRVRLPSGGAYSVATTNVQRQSPGRKRLLSTRWDASEVKNDSPKASPRESPSRQSSARSIRVVLAAGNAGPNVRPLLRPSSAYLCISALRNDLRGALTREWVRPNLSPQRKGLTWPGQDSNLRATDYESAALTN